MTEQYKKWRRRQLLQSLVGLALLIIYGVMPAFRRDMYATLEHVVLVAAIALLLTMTELQKAPDRPLQHETSNQADDNSVEDRENHHA